MEKKHGCEPHMRGLAVNTRVLSSHLTGVQRYLRSVLKHLPGAIEQVRPTRSQHGMHGHAWEQCMLPFRLSGRVLWSPSNTGPLSVSNQVLTVHDLVPVDHPEFLNPRFASWYRFLLPKLVHRVSHIIAISEFTKSRIMDAFGVPSERISVVWNGVDGMFSPRSDEQVKFALKELGIPSRRYLVALGSLEPRKNLKRLLDAWSRVATHLPEDVWLVLAGAQGKALVFDGVSFDTLPPRVHLTGHVPDAMLPALYAGAIAAPYVSVYEGFGLPPLEAMACGTPALTSNCTALPEVVGDAALTVDPYDTEAIGDCLRTLIMDEALQGRLRLRGLEQAAKFRWERTAAQTWSVLQSVARA